MLSERVAVAELTFCVVCRQIIGFCNLILQAQEAAVDTEDYERWMTVTRKVTPQTPD